MSHHRTFAFIPARGGSKRLPGKNILLFGGHPLIAWSIAYAQYHKVSDIFVSTDNDEIKQVALAYGAKVIHRPEHLSGDLATTASAARHCLEEVSKQNIKPDLFITLQPTNPLRPVTLLPEALLVFKNKSCDSVISVNLNKHKLGTLNEGYYLPETYEPGMRSQDIKPLYFENGLLYISKPNAILKEDFFGKKIQTVVTEDLFANTDIDTEEDFALADFIYCRYKDKFEYLNNILCILNSK